MKLEEGKTYQTREPEFGTVTVTRRKDYSGMYPWLGSNSRTYTDDGSERLWTKSNVDLVAEVPAEAPKLQLEEGKLYETRNPELGPVTVTRRKDCHGEYSWLGSNYMAYTDAGKFWAVGGPHPYDLVAEVPAEPDDEKLKAEFQSYVHRRMRDLRTSEPKTMDQRIGDLEREVAELRRAKPVCSGWEPYYVRVTAEQWLELKKAIDRAATAEELRKELPIQLSPEQRKALDEGEKLVAIERAREEFEAWAKKESLLLWRISDTPIFIGDYLHGDTQDAWTAWMAAKGLA